MQPDREIMRQLIRLAIENHRDGGHAVAAAVVRGSQILATGVTTIVRDSDPTAHAEVNAIRTATKAAGSRFLEGCWLYTTFEPCPMCTAAAVWAKMDGIAFGARMSDQTPEHPQRIALPAEIIARHGTPTLKLVPNVLRKECIDLLHLHTPA